MSILQQRQNIHLQLENSEKKLKELQRQVLASQKMATMGLISCMAAHEFNNLLTPIISYAELALDNPQDGELALKSLRKVLKQGRKAAEIIQSMLELAQNGTVEPEKVSLRELLQDCFNCLARDLSKDNIITELDIPDNFSITVNRGQFQQVMLNLIINARHAMLAQRGGKLTIKSWRQSENMLVIEVSDTGDGIAAENLNRIFNPFFTTKGVRGETPSAKIHGSGMGLATCKTIIEAHQGKITVSSTPQQGTTFTIILPDSAEK